VSLRGKRPAAPADLARLAGLDRLDRLDLANTSIRDEDLDFLPDLPELGQLDLSLTAISNAGLADLPRRWPGLQELVLSGTSISDEGISHLAGLTKLESLDLAGTRIWDAGLKSLKDLAGIKRLVLDYTAISDSGLAHLTEFPCLEYVSVAGTEVSDAGVERLQELETLKGVCVLYTRVGADGIDNLRDKLPNCVVEGDARQSVDLLSLIDPSRDAVDGKWQFESESLVSPDGPCVRLQVPYPPPEEYGLELVASRRSGDSHLIVGFVMGGRQGTLNIGLDTAQDVGLSQIDGMPANESEAGNTTEVFTGSEPARVLITVRRSHLTVTSGERVLIDWRGDPGRLSVNPVWAVPDENSPFVGWYRSSFAISRFRLLPISETGKVVATPQGDSPEN